MEENPNKSANTKREFTELHKIRLSEAIKKSWEKRRLRHPKKEKPVKERKSRKGIPLTEEHKAKMTVSAKAMWQRPEYRARIIAKQKRLGLRNYPVQK